MSGMVEFIVEHWQLIASVVLALFNLVLTLSVHAISTHRIKNGSPGIIGALSTLIDANSAILEILKNEKKDKQS